MSIPAYSNGRQRHHDSELASDKTIDEVCCALLDDLFPRAGGVIWKAPVILQLKVDHPPEY